MKQLTREEFDNKLSSGDKFIVDFYASWCGPCKMMMPIIESTSKQLTEQSSSVSVYKFDIESDRDLTAQLGIRGVPTIKAFTGGKEVFTKSGIMRETELMDLAKNVLHG
jgi:thioredoxin 1